MAIIKKVELDNGIILNYHRITSLNKITNISNNIEVSSYINEEQRLKEKEYQQLQIKNSKSEELTEEEQNKLNNGINVFIRTDYIKVNYDSDMTIEDAYDYLKTLDKFKNSKDN